VHDVTVRPATLDDHAAIASLAGELGYPTGSEEMRVRLQDLLDGEGEAVFVAVADGDVVGWIQVGVTHSLESGDFAEIRGLVVNESQRSRGVGAQLVAHAELWTETRGLRRVRVRSNVIRERTHRFYLRVGYTTHKSQVVFEKVRT